MGPKLVSIFVRHGETAGNAKNLFRGKLDFPLDKKGITAAKQMNPIFKKIAVSDVYRSDKTRTEQTAHFALKGTGIEPSVTKDLNAWNLGYLSGKNKDAHKSDVKYFTNNPDTHVPGGESLNAFRNRVQPKVKMIIAKGIKAGVPSVAFTHSSVIHELSHMIHGDPKYVKVKPGGMVGVFHDGDKLSVKALLKPLGESDLGYGG